MKIDIRKFCLILALIGITCSFAGGALLAQSLGQGYVGVGQENVDQKKSIPVSQLDGISVSTVSSDVRWHETSEQQIRAHLHGTAGGVPPELRVNQDGADVTVEVYYQPGFGLHGGDRTVLDVYVPQGALQRADLRAVSGDIDFTRVTAKDVRCSTVSGEIVGDGVVGQTSTFKAASGDIKVKGLTGRVEATAISGDVKLEYGTFTETDTARLSSTSGDVALDLPDSARFQLNADTVSGSISSTFPITVTTGQGKRHLVGSVAGGENEISIHTVSGDIRVH